jgi:hypothetical protein
MARPLFDILLKAFENLPQDSECPEAEARHLFYTGAASALDILMDGTDAQRKAVMREIAEFLQSRLPHVGNH